MLCHEQQFFYGLSMVAGKYAV